MPCSGSPNASFGLPPPPSRSEKRRIGRPECYGRFRCMPRYRVELAQTVVERAVVWIEADSSEEAERLALAESAINLADWRFAESFGDIEVLETTEQKR